MGTLARVLQSKKVRIGFVYGNYGNLSNGVTGALFDLEVRVAEWIGKLHTGSDKLLEPDWIGFDAAEDMFEALRNGTIDMTGSLYWQGGVDTRTQEPMKHTFRPSCSAMSFVMNFTVLKNSTLETVDDLLAYTSPDPVAISAIAFSSFQFVDEFLRNVSYGVELLRRTTVDDVVADVRSGRALAGVMPFVSTAHIEALGLRYIATPYILPFCSFFRRDTALACGDGVVDTALGEECEADGVGCEQCRCTARYLAAAPPGRDCVYNTRRHRTILVAALVPSLAVLVALVLVGVFVVGPRIRARYMSMGANRMKSMMISDRYGTTPAEQEMPAFGHQGRTPSQRAPVVQSPLAPSRQQPPPS